MPVPFASTLKLAVDAARRPELPVILAVAATALALWLFLALAGEVREGETRAFDETILLAFRHAGDPADPIGPRWLEEAVRDFSALGSTGVLALLTAMIAGYLLIAGKRGAMLAVLFAVLGGAGVSQLLKLGFERPRPDLVPHATQVFTASFPSGHSMMSAVVYLTLGAMLARVQPDNRAVRIYFFAMATLLTVIVGVSRVYLGVHWPTDVLAGWTVGAAWALLCWLVTLWLQRRGKVEPA
jgi:undecaprenyl-diphosphatase